MSNYENECDMWDAIVEQECKTMKIGTGLNWEQDLYEADLEGELIDMLFCDWCGKPEYDLIPFYGEDTNPTDATYLICEDCNIVRDRIDETGAPF